MIHKKCSLNPQILPVISCILFFTLCCNCVHQPQPFYMDASEDLVEHVLKTNNLNISSAEELKEKEIEEEAFIDHSMDFADHQDRELVTKWITYFTTKGRNSFQRHLTRGLYYKSMIQTLLKNQGIPTYFYYLALIESGFNVKAKSKAKAIGVWQFMSGTGRRYGLRVDRYVDERKDPIRSTIAAAKFLKDLHNVFQSWFLAAAAYNSGESRVMGTIMKHGSRDYWELVKKKALPRETRNYIPKFIAAYLIGSHPEKYGFDAEVKDTMPPYMSVIVPSPVKLITIAKMANEPLSKIRDYNPHLKTNITPPYAKTYRVWMRKKDNQDELVIKLKKIARLDNVETSPFYYRIKKGDSLYRIARKFGIHVNALKDLNGLTSNKIILGHKLLIRTDDHSTQGKTYRVRKGDNLSIVAKRFKTTVKKLIRLNDLTNSIIYPGQLIKTRS